LQGVESISYGWVRTSSFSGLNSSCVTAPLLVRRSRLVAAANVRALTPGHGRSGCRRLNDRLEVWLSVAVCLLVATIAWFLGYA
jgi:hypothetical protein